MWVMPGSEPLALYDETELRGVEGLLESGFLTGTLCPSSSAVMGFGGLTGGASSVYMPRARILANQLPSYEFEAEYAAPGYYSCLCPTWGEPSGR